MVKKKKWLGIMEKRLRRDEQTKTMAPKTKSPTAALFLTANHNLLIQSQKGHDTINPLRTRRLRSHGNSWATSEDARRVAKTQPRSSAVNNHLLQQGANALLPLACSL